MRKLRYLLVLVVLMAVSLCSCGSVDKGNLLENGSFSTVDNKSSKNDGTYDGIGSWSLLGMNSGKGTFDIEKKQAVIRIQKYGGTVYSIQFNQKGLTLNEGTIYSVGFDGYAENEQEVAYIVQMNYGTYDAYFEEKVSLTTSKQHFENTFTATKNDKDVSFCINMGYKQDGLTENTIYLDNIYLKVAGGKEVEQENLERYDILVNQVGYYPESEKYAIIRGKQIDRNVKLVNAETGAELETFVATTPVDNKGSDERCSVVDFSSFKTPGKYKLVTKGSGESFVFEIKDHIYDDLLSTSIDFLYTQRCGTEVIDDVCGHPICHNEDAVIYDTQTKIDTRGGWHDAGDYGKYIVAGAKTVSDLLLTYELYGDVYKYSVNIPEAKNTTPDLLDEAIYELDWMLKMQNDDGEVYHKVSSYSFPGDNVAPDKDNYNMVVSPVSYAATGDFAAVMAQAARVLASIDSTRSAKYKAAAVKAYKALAKMEKVSYINPSNIQTGEYPDSVLDDEALWAQAELYRLTSDNAYMNDFNTLFASTKKDNVFFGWDNMYGYAFYAYLKANTTSATNYSKVLKALTDAADKYKKNIEADAYGSSVGNSYGWGSNLVICNSGMLFILLNDLGTTTYLKYITNELNYLLGVNTTAYSFVTGFGSRSPQNPHHRPSTCAKKAVPGMVVGGPNNDFDNNGGDSVATKLLKGKASPAGSYVDNVNSWSTNEVTIYWNSPFILMLTGVIKNA